ncbi:acyltransferase family protein [Acinetobacter sp. MB5]|uniref:acyltransferase family protein n=1 Tax=Acinetobacter sp. MB5 TaxID=2069438 RepID=UPI000DD0BFA8|nr:acyltransferase family protein [Acinetobacter sp. MB5]
MRDQSIDIYKGLLIFLVVFGHFLERFLGWQNELGKMLLQSIYLVHMPAFIFISGYLFKDQKISKKIQYFLSLLIPFQLLYVLLDHYYGGYLSSKWLWQPYWLLWYLWAMLAWVILTRLLKITAYPVLLSFLLSLFIGLSPINNYILSIGRIFNFLPFFMLGHIYGQRIFTQLKQLPYAIVWVSGLLIAIVIFIQYLPLKSYWLYGSFSYQQMHVAPLQGMLQRSGYLGLSLLSLLSMYVLIQRLPQFFEKLGQNSLAIYLWHGLILLWLSHVLHLSESPLAKLGIALFGSMLICSICMLPIFNQSIQKISQVFLLFFTKLRFGKTTD